MRRNTRIFRSKLLAGASVAALVSAILAAGQAPAATQGPPSHTVREGAARFEVLTPTLIRLEYAADGHFEDGATFNVINRDLPVPKFSTTNTDGWLVINTDQLTLRYRDGSGPFDPSNTSISVNGSGSTVTGHPSWPAAPGQCAFGTRCETEDGRLNGGESVNYDH